MLMTFEHDDHIHIWRSDGTDYDVYKPTPTERGGWVEISPHYMPGLFTQVVTDSDGEWYIISCTVPSSPGRWYGPMLELACVEYPV